MHFKAAKLVLKSMFKMIERPSTYKLIVDGKKFVVNYGKMRCDCRNYIKYKICSYLVAS